MVKIVPLSKNPRFMDLTGKTFGRWTVDGFAGRQSKKQDGHWACTCDCGTVKSVSGQSLRAGLTRSCGCYARSKDFSKHPLYSIFAGAKGRCENINVRNFEQYGGRGIKFKFRSPQEIEEAAGVRPSPDHSLDRIDNDGHYEHGNVRWATQKQQLRNKGNNLYLTINGIVKAASEWLEYVELNPSTLYMRIRDHGWCDMCAVFVLPARGHTCIHR